MVLEEVTSISPTQERLNRAIKQLEDCNDMPNDMIGSVELRNTNSYVANGLQYMQIEYTKHVGKLPLKIIECAMVNKGVKRLFTLPVIQDTMNTRTYLLYNPDKAQRKRYLADSNKIIKFDFIEPYYSKNPIYHFIDKTSAAQLGHISNESKIDSKYLYVISEMYGLMSYMEALTEIPDMDTYESFISETELFETQLEESKDIMKIKYKMYSIENNRKILTNIDGEITKLLQNKGLVKTTKEVKEENTIGDDE